MAQKATETPMIPRKKKKFFQTMWDNRVFLMLVAPGTLFLIVFFYIPVFANVVAFQNFQYSDQGFIYSVLHSPWVVCCTAHGWALITLNSSLNQPISGSYYETRLVIV